MDKFLKTIAFQVSDPEFFAEYEKRQKESGLKVKDYFFGLIKADIAQNQTQQDNLSPDNSIETESSEPEQSAEITNQQTEEMPAPADVPEQTAEPEEQQNQPTAPAQDEEMMNLFVKIPREQRVALECHKNETGETVGSVLNRLINDFLKRKQENNLSESFLNGFKHFSSNDDLCDTKASAKIPIRANQELTDYISDMGGSRNTLIATLVEMEMSDHTINEDQEQDNSMGMTM